EVENLTDLGNTLAIHDVEFDLLEGRRDLVFHDLHPCGIADNIVAILDLPGTPNVQADRSVEFQGVAASGGFGITVHHTDLHAELVDKDHHAARAADRTGELPERLAHQPGLQADMAVAHFPLDFGPRHQRGDRIDHQHVDRIGTHQRIDDLQRLLARIG